MVDFNAASKAALPTVKKKRTTLWEPSVVNVFLDKAGGHRLGPLFELDVHTGLRRGEICGLRWSDVDIDRRELTVRVQLTQLSSGALEGPIKTDEGQDRVVSLGAEAVEALMLWKLRQDMERHTWGSAYVESGRVFTYQDGSQLLPQYVSRTFIALAKAAAVPKMRFHDLRHLHASLLITAGVPLAVISKRLGHTTISVTSDLYGHLLREADQQAADAMSALLANPSVRTLLTQEE